MPRTEFRLCLLGHITLYRRLQCRQWINLLAEIQVAGYTIRETNVGVDLAISDGEFGCDLTAWMNEMPVHPHQVAQLRPNLNGVETEAGRLLTKVKVNCVVP